MIGSEPQVEDREVRVGGETEAYAALASLRRFGEIIPGKLRPRRASFCFTFPSHHATTQECLQTVQLD